MLTSRALFFLTLAIGLLALGLCFHLHAVLLIGLTLIIWFLLQWVLFTIRSNVVCRKLAVDRQVRDEGGPVETLWPGKTFEVHVAVRSQSMISSPGAAITDWVPLGCRYLSGATRYQGLVEAGGIVRLVYQIRCEMAGRIRFEGIQIQLADFQGFFRHVAFLRAPIEHRVLPRLVNERGRPSAVRRYSLLPPPGLHPLRRPGSGSELLDLRDYIPGDPPRTIAWKLSARRDKLITKEFESEVPVRCTLFVDISHSVRLGAPGRNALALLIDVAAAVAQANSNARDMTGICLFDESTTTVVRPARNAAHLSHLLKILADAAGLSPAPGMLLSMNCCRWPTPWQGRFIPICSVRRSIMYLSGCPGYGRCLPTHPDAVSSVSSAIGSSWSAPSPRSY